MKLSITAVEWYLLYKQLDKHMQENPNSVIAKGLLNQLESMKTDVYSQFTTEDFIKEYESRWVGEEG